MTSELMLDVLKDNNLKTLTIIDSSYYLDAVENLLLEVLSPYSSKWVTHKVNPSFLLTLNASSLGLAKVKSVEELPVLMDGIYELKISHKPNFSSVKHFYHFNIKNLLFEYYSALEDLYSQRCTITNTVFEQSRDVLLKIKMDIDAIKWMVEIAHKKEEGKELYKKVSEDLKKYNNECGCFKNKFF